MKINNRNCEKGFALALALIMIVVMSIMGATIMQVVSKDHQSNNLRNDKQQTYYAAETGITEAKRWLLSEPSLSAGNTPSPKFCYTSFFPDLVDVRAINRINSIFCIVHLLNNMGHSNIYSKTLPSGL